MAIPVLRRVDNIMLQMDMTAVYKTIDGDFELGKFPSSGGQPGGMGTRDFDFNLFAILAYFYGFSRGFFFVLFLFRSMLYYVRCVSHRIGSIQSAFYL